ncbi:phosphate-regulating neutral endopeptidase PHEX [Leucoraja erinacea]|uniref:phosphate-regulating neutral endopeptidase PHEX n=1 Tax=Leucoraja erinaceus TaxID=7782 RepID=UPI0024539CD1|nr:phosphate-regulating neutral endopeptidase PHEX [Leucoraja erinacea]
MQMEVLENAKPTTGRCRNKRLKVALLLSVAVAVALGIVLALAGNRVISLHSEEYCLTAECAEAAVFIFNKINWSADPCDNFFNFACGRWQKETPIPEDYSSYGTYAWVQQNVKVKLRALLENPIDAENDIEAIQKAKQLYQSCMNESAIELEDDTPLLNFLKQPPLRWPVLEENNGANGTWKENEFDLLETLAFLRGIFGNNILISFFVSVDDKNSDFYILKLDQGHLFLPSVEDYLTNSTAAKSARRVLLQLMIDVAILLGANATTAQADMEAALEFEIKVAEILIPQSNRTNEATYNKLSVLDLQHAVPQFDWLRYIWMVIDEELYPELTQINMSEEVIVYVPQYFKDLFQLLETVDNRTVANYLVWRIVYRRLGNLSRRFLDRQLELLKVIMGMKSLPPRWDKCVRFTEYVLPYSVGRMFVKAHFQEDKKKLTEDLVAGVRWAFLDILDKENDWMDAETKEKAKEKAQAVLAKIGYPKFILIDEIVNDICRNLTVLATDYFGNVLRSLNFIAQHDFASLRYPVSKTAWFTNPTTVNAFYAPTVNQIQFPAGELQKPFFWGEKYPLSISYGAIGVIVGHEFSHAFDDSGREYDKNGNLHQWWSNASISKFKAEAECVVKQYSDYYWPPAGLMVKGQQTLGENIADNAGLRQAFRAYRKWIREKRGNKEEALLPGLKLNHNQLFFLSYAHVRCSVHRPASARNNILTGYHSPPEFRVIGSMSNFEEFSKAYNCPRMAPMNQAANACRVW